MAKAAISVAAAAGLCLLGLFGCGGRRRTADETTKAAGVTRTFERGPVRVAVSLDRAEATIADRLHLTLETVAAEEYETEFPRVGEKLEQFGIVDYRTPQPELVASNLVRTVRSYVLEPFLSGEYSIPPMKILFWSKAAPSKKHEIETEEIKVVVKSLLPEKAASLKIHEIAGPVLPPAADRTRLIAIAAGCLALLAGVAVLLLRRRGARAATAAAVPAHEQAIRQLEELVAANLLTKGQIKLFYQKLSDILRHYIENRFGLRAPEQTSEEFLESLRTDEALSARYQSLLEEFLTQCDLVKFAEHQPASNDVQAAFDSCKRFIFETAEPAPAVKPVPSG